MKEQPRFRDEIQTVVKAVEGALGQFFPPGDILAGIAVFLCVARRG